MKTVNAAMKSYLKSDFVQLATCVNMTLPNGKTLAFTDWDQPVTYGGITYQTAYETLTRSALDQQADLSVPAVEVTGLLGQESLSAGGVNASDVDAGTFDGGTFQVFMMVPTDTNGATYDIIKMRAGRIGNITIEEGQYTFELRGLASLLTQTLLRSYVIGCDADLFDTRCKLSSASFTDTGTVNRVDSTSTFTASMSQLRTSGFYQFGTLTWTGGLNSGTSVEMKAHDASGGIGAVAFGLYLPAGYTIQVGDTFTAQAGCDKSHATCINKFNNAINFRGFPYIPGFDTLMYPNATLAYTDSSS